MSFFGGKPAAAATPTQLNSINVDQSRYGDPVPLVYGVNRIPMTLLWYGAFSATAQYNSGSGKGGKGPPSGYAYTASAVMGLCEGPIQQIFQVWKDKDLTSLETEGLTLFLGAGGQAPWSYLTSNFPAQAVPYDHTAYLAEANLTLGNSAALPNYTFEVQGFLARAPMAFNFVSGLAANSYQGQVATIGVVPDGEWDVTFSDRETRTATFLTTAGVQIASWDTTLGLVNGVGANALVGGYDAEMSAILIDYCTDVNHGAGFNNLNQSQITSHSWTSGGTTYYDSFKVYATALGLFISPYEDTQRKATDFIKDMLQIGNSNSVMSAGSFKIVPYGDSAISGNGVTYTPNLQPLFSFTDDDFMPNNQGTNNDPVVVIRKPLTDTYNVVRVEFLDRGNSYNTALAEWTDPLDIAVNGIRVMSNITLHQICDARVAGVVAALIGQRQLYIRNHYQFTVRADYSILEPMDLVSITEAGLGVTDLLLRITEIEDDENDIFTITAEEMFIGTASAPKYNFQLAQGYAANFATLPLSVAPPVIFAAPPSLVGSGGGYEIWIAVGQGSDTYEGSPNGTYGGCTVYASLDEVTYTLVGTHTGGAKYGAIPSNVGATDSSISVTLNAGAIEANLQLSSASAADFANNRALIYLDGEIIGFENAILTSVGNYTLSPVSRGLFGTGPSPGVGIAHSAGASWARLDESIFVMPIDPGMTGQTVEFKFPSFNSVVRAQQTLAEAVAYPYSIQLQSASETQFIARGNALVSDTFAQKLGGVSAWDSDIYSIVPYSTCNLSWKANDTVGNFMAALVTAVPATPGYTALPFALQCNAGTLDIYENGTSVGTFGTYATADRLSITFDGTNVVYAQNGITLRSVAAGGTFDAFTFGVSGFGEGATGEVAQCYADLVFFTAGSGANSINWGPGATVPVVDSSALGENAATIVAATSNAGPIVENNTSGSGVVTTPVTVTMAAPTDDSQALIVTITCEAESSELTPYGGDVNIQAFMEQSGTVTQGNSNNINNSREPITSQFAFSPTNAGGPITAGILVITAGATESTLWQVQVNAELIRR